MDFIHRHDQENDTIAAIATPAGEGAIAIVRLSGKNAFKIANKIFTGPVLDYKTHTAHYGKILNDNGSEIDAVLLLVMKGPRSYTGEDSVEIHCHGGRVVTKQVLQRVYEAGARPATPGEFTYRAYMNGKIDLTQAEAVQELISARNEWALKLAENQLQGTLSKKIQSFQKDLVDIAAILEAWVDFPEEDLEFASFDDVCRSVEKTCDQMQKLADTFHEGKIISDGFTLALAGAPNVGKSSLMNALLKKDRAIVTPIAGTTRDLLEEDLTLGNLHFRLIDTAGVRQTDELIEKEGIIRSEKAIDSADIILLVLDASRELEKEDLHLLEKAPKEKTLIIWNKIDLAPPTTPLPHKEIVHTSAKKEVGLEDLSKSIENLLWKSNPPSRSEILITEMRHKEALQAAISSCKQVITGLQNNISAEFISSDMRHALQELGSIIGTNVTEDILSAIFSKFCLGK